MAKKKNRTINPNDIKTRDWLMVGIIEGRTKAGIHRSKKRYLRKPKHRKNGYDN